MKAAIAGNTSLTYYCLEYLCRSGMTDLILILPRNNHNDNYDLAEFDSLVREFALPYFKIPVPHDENDIPEVDLLVCLEWPERLRLPLNPRSGVISTNLFRQFSTKSISDLAAALDSGADHFKLELALASPATEKKTIVAAVELPICEFDNLRSLKTKAAAATARQLLGMLTEGRFLGENNPRAGTGLLTSRFDRAIDWYRPVGEIQNKVRAYTHPGPGCITRMENHSLYVWHGHAFDKSSGIYERAEPGTVLDVVEEVGIALQAADGSFLITKIQQAGAPELPSWVWAYGFHLKPGDRFDSVSQGRVTLAV